MTDKNIQRITSQIYTYHNKPPNVQQLQKGINAYKRWTFNQL